MQSDSTTLCNKAAIVSGDPSTWHHTTHERDLGERLHVHHVVNIIIGYS
jgi:hypothetical protein